MHARYALGKWPIRELIYIRTTNPVTTAGEVTLPITRSRQRSIVQCAQPKSITNTTHPCPRPSLGVLNSLSSNPVIFSYPRPQSPFSLTVENSKSLACGVHIVLTDRQPSPVHDVCESINLATGMASFGNHDSGCRLFNSCNCHHHDLLIDRYQHPHNPGGTQVRSASICSSQYNGQSGRYCGLRILPNKSFCRESRLSRSLCTSKRKHLLLGGIR